MCFSEIVILSIYDDLGQESSTFDAWVLSLSKHVLPYSEWYIGYDGTLVQVAARGFSGEFPASGNGLKHPLSFLLRPDRIPLRQNDEKTRISSWISDSMNLRVPRELCIPPSLRTTDAESDLGSVKTETAHAKSDPASGKSKHIKCWTCLQTVTCCHQSLDAGVRRRANPASLSWPVCSFTSLMHVRIDC